MNELARRLQETVIPFLAREALLTPETIRERIAEFRYMPTFADVTDEAAEDVARQIETILQVVIDDVVVVQGGGQHKPWLPGRKAATDWYYWQRYRSHLASGGLPPQVLSNLDDVSDRSLGLLEDPRKEGEWDRRGLVLGNVQSGKTANYLGLICKAADAGYKVIIVIAGIHNNLRNQTQVRIDQGFVGRSLRPAKGRVPAELVGVGRLDARRVPIQFTASTRDFSQAVANGVGVPLRALNEPAVFVIKKNSTTLANLLGWLKPNMPIEAPLLLIDDEADNASINVSRGPGEVTRINGQIRELLKMFKRSCYVGYTATPFANFFIYPDDPDDLLGDDLFPRDFIVSLEAPSNYFGARRVFLEDPDDYVRPIDDNEDALPLRHQKTHQVDDLPDSLKDAIRAFVVARAIRLRRGHLNSHNSMLVNASRFTDVHDGLSAQIRTLLDGIKASIGVNGQLEQEEALRDPQIAELHRVWEEQYAAACAWSDLYPHLHSSAAPIEVRTVNARSSGSLHYDANAEHGLNVIAVGGFSLSRGLTLEGLVVTYFLRNSTMYDTLLQMGRWFGYRPDYEDLCRIWMTEESQGYFEHIAESVEILRDDLKAMERAGETPMTFGLRVRAHPDALMITARNKVGRAEVLRVQVSLAGSLVETHTLSVESFEHNRRIAREFVETLADCPHARLATAPVFGLGELFQDVPAERVSQFIESFENDPASLLSSSKQVAAYVEGRTDLTQWDVLLASRQGSPGDIPLMFGGHAILPQKRTIGDGSTPQSKRIGNKQHVAGRGVERAGLSQAQVESAQENHRRFTRAPDPGKPWSYPDKVYRAERRRGLLVIHVLRLREKDDPEALSEPVVAWSASFPYSWDDEGNSIQEATTEYVVNEIFLRELNKRRANEIEEGDEDAE